MAHSPNHSLLRLATGLLASTLLAFIIACATTPPPPSTLAHTSQPPTIEPTSITHQPRQHSGEHIPGLGDPLDTPHFVDSFPNHAQTLTQSPDRIGINFDVALTPESGLTLERDGTSLKVGVIEFDSRAIYMSAVIPPDSGDGLYMLNYHACFLQENCSDGRIGFRVDSTRVQEFLDLTNQPNVTIHLKDIQYQPHQIIISRGTTVTWVNDDPFEHFVNSDPHPSHNAHPKLNSLEIPPTQTFSYVFDERGEYAFHCSAHVPQNMYGTILVREQSQVVIPATEVAQAEPTTTPAPTLPPTFAATAVPTVIPTRVLTRVPVVVSTEIPAKAKADEAGLPPQRFAAHFVSSSPEHADLIPAAPQAIQLYFNFVLARNSNINVRKDGDKLALGALEFSENRLQMTVQLPDAGAGTYHVLYRACWPDKSCHDGEFAFVVAP